MPRKKKEQQIDEPISVLHPEEEQTEDAIAVEELIKPVTEPERNIEPESCSRNYLTASLQSAQSSITGLFEAQAQLAGTQIADKVFDQLEEAFVNRLQERLQPFVDVLVPEIKDSHAQLQERATARIQRRQGVFDRLKQIATLVTDECRLSLPSGEPTGNLLGFASWDTDHDQQENE